ncbi:C13 family peptidase [Geomonas ferrireducens]|uniref:C13 family peptidase n=1 Tax=Geomonas ferrireducens TaxID=2570227 RepID=UPI001FE7E4A9|nr:C13 family peptidase [Geomonas ferrireducens]
MPNEPDMHKAPEAAPITETDRPDAPAEDATATACGAEETGLPLRPEPAPRRALFLQLGRDLLDGVRGVLFLRSELETLSTLPANLVMLVLADLAFNLLVSFLLVGRGGSFYSNSLPYFLFYLPLFLLFGVAAQRLLAPRSGVVPLAAALVAFSIPVEFCHGALEWLAQWRRFEVLSDYLSAPHYYRFFGWWAAASLVFLLRLKARNLSRRVGIALLFLALVATPLWFFQRGDLWASGEGGNESGALTIDDEVLSAQQRLLEGELSRLRHGRPGVTDLYFVGFAGDASQDVFLKELTVARQTFDGRFGTAGRSVLLVNNPQSATALPFATVGNLERALARVGEVMNRDEDVLFLYLSSHGSRDHELAVSNAPLELKQVTPELLKRLLVKSGIRYKVVVVSACFSGGFVEPLRDAGSLVITASDATHESFGCGFGENFTWFGEAFVGQALKETFSFTKAFEKSRETIGKWEEERGETPSNPQIWIGDRVLPVLERLQKELEHRGGGSR